MMRFMIFMNGWFLFCMVYIDDYMNINNIYLFYCLYYYIVYKYFSIFIRLY